MNKPVWLWWSGTRSTEMDVDRCWQSFLRRFDIEHTFEIQVDIDWWPTDIKRCVPPGETHLGTTDEIDNAWAIPGTCG
ncbi:DUF6355 family natural product biosynthesis protein [Streptomyces griseorubiginosus]|uniref:DUF6355 family natural product biosynthesis protein n=1 Tax=Streptomyces griseorubiginosus TaxID=67304 RepID=UPI00200F36A5|nr:DUF6355 family natural product biosynthesis protein [Streptomyces griseorubiginosus]